MVHFLEKVPTLVPTQVPTLSALTIDRQKLYFSRKWRKCHLNMNTGTENLKCRELGRGLTYEKRNELIKRGMGDGEKQWTPGKSEESVSHYSSSFPFVLCLYPEMWVPSLSLSFCFDCHAKQGWVWPSLKSTVCCLLQLTCAIYGVAIRSFDGMITQRCKSLVVQLWLCPLTLAPVVPLAPSGHGRSIL